ncbi:MAG: hypothetical protein J0I25_12010 [Sphingomonadales bacterium]|nr:hypothetical protein [Sphingomonadales bacterium]
MMLPPDSLPLEFSWSLAERDARLASWPQETGAIGGRWAFDLITGRMTWERGVYDLFGFEPETQLTRRSAVDCYIGESRAAMEQLRAHAISNRRGFTLDVAIAPANGAPHRWMRLIAAPSCTRGRAVRLEGVKFDVTPLHAPLRTVR